MAIKIKFAIIAALFDYNPKLLDTKKPDSWEKCMAGGLPAGHDGGARDCCDDRRAG
jgi:hypothetical protein